MEAGVPGASPAALAAAARALSGVGAVAGLLRAAGVPAAWLVGGTLRDLAAGVPRRTLDLDLAVPGDGAVPARAVAAGLGGSAFPLDEAEGAWRVALPGGGTVDVIPWRAADLDQDLRGRDFTVNALALDLLGDGGLRDPVGGLADLAAGVLRPCGPEALAADPLRVLRAFRFAAALGLAFAPGLSEGLVRAAPGLSAVAPERVRAELFALLALPDGPGTLGGLADHGVLGVLFPETRGWAGFDQGSYHAHDLWEHSVRTALRVGELVRDSAGLPRPTELAAHLAEELESGVTRRALLVFAALFHDVAKPATVTDDGGRRRFLGHEVLGGQRVRRLLAGLRVGRRARTAAERVVAAHLRLFQLAHQERATRRARVRYLMDLGSEVPEALLLALADEAATGPEPPALARVTATAAEVLELYWQRRDRQPPPPLLRGRDLVKDLGLAPGPRVGAILAAVAAAEAQGDVETRAEALALAQRLAAPAGPTE